MNGKGLTIWLFLSALLSTLASAAPNNATETDREQILALLADEIPPARLQRATVFLGGDLAAMRLPARTGESVVYVFERQADDAMGWNPVARITAPEEEHFGDAVLLSPSAILVAAPDTADAGLGPGATYVFQRHVGGKDQWGLIAKLAPGDYPPPGAIRVQQLVESAVAPPPPAAVTTPPPATEPAPSPTRVAEPLPPTAAMPPPPAVAAPSPPITPPPAAAAEKNPPVAETEGSAPATGAEKPPGDDEPPASTDELRYIAVANMRERPRALALAASLRDKGYPSEVHRNDRDFFIVTLARLPRAEAREKREEAVAAGDVSQDAYLIIGTGFREKIKPQ